MQRFERRRGRPRQRHVELLHRRQRLAELLAEPRAAAPSEVSTSSLLAASTCSRAMTSPVSALIASSAST